MKKTNIVKVSLFTLILAFIAIGTIAVAKVMNKEKTVDVEQMAPTSGWYIINISDPADPNNEANQEIGSLDSAPPQTDPFGCALEDNDGNVCMVELTFESNATTVPATVAAARATGSLTTVGEKAYSPKE